MKHAISKYLKQHYRVALLAMAMIMFMALEVNAQDGKALFKQNCGVCHTTTQQKLVGPGLEGITTKRSEEWLIKWIKDSQAFVQSGDADAKAAFEAGDKMVMPPFSTLSDGDIKAILSFIGTPETAAPVAAAPAAAPVVAEKAPWSTGTKLFIAVLVLLVIALAVYLYILRYNLRRLGYSLDTRPLGDRVSYFFKQNGRFLMFVAVVIVALVMKSCISELM